MQKELTFKAIRIRQIVFIRLLENGFAEGGGRITALV